jgi:DNA-binding SARP family transcriptional activator
MTSNLHIQLLGDFSISKDGQELLSGRGNTRMSLLLAYLLLKRNRRQSREQIAYLFWKDSTDRQARSNLRSLLTALRKQAASISVCLRNDETHLCWRSDPTQVIDVAEFESALERAATFEQAENTEVIVDALKQAIALYTGELLPACYEDWVLAERQRLQTAYLDALLWLIDLLEKTDRSREATRYAELLWQADPLRETSIFLLMRLYASVGDRARALSLYAKCARLLVEELGVEPGSAVEELHRRLLQEPEQARGTHRNGEFTGEAVHARIGRAEQWENLVESWRVASAGAAHIVMLTGEAGVGKSYLAHEFCQWCSAQGAVVLSTTCPQARAPVTYVALAPLLASRRLAHRIERLDAADLTCLQMLSPALRRRYPVRHLEALSSQWQQLRLQQALATLFTDPAEPTLIMLDDAQWCDEQSFEWLHYLFAMEPTARLLVLMAVGEGGFEETPFQRASAALLAKGHIRQVELRRLSFEETARLAQSASSQSLDERTIERLYAASAGNPFFVIELVRMLDDAPGAKSGLLTDGALPASVSALVMHRLSALSHAARQLLDVAAVVGAQFTLALLRRVERTPESALLEALDELWRCGLIVEAGNDIYAFRHELVRQVIYRQLSDVRRRHLHQRVAEATTARTAVGLNGMFADEGNLIAEHYALAGNFGEATDFYEAFMQSYPGGAAFLRRSS